MRLIGTHNKSYIPSLIAVNIRGTGATAENKVSEFGVNLAPEDQNILCSLAGRYSGKNLDKAAYSIMQTKSKQGPNAGGNRRSYNVYWRD
jgi:hypothetical protein